MTTPKFSEEEKKAILSSFGFIACSDTENEKWETLESDRSDESFLQTMNPEEWEFLDKIAINLGFGTKFVFLMTELEKYQVLVGQLGITECLYNLDENGKDWYIDTAHKLIFADGNMTIQEKLILDDIFDCMGITEEKINEVVKKSIKPKSTLNNSNSTRANKKRWEELISMENIIPGMKEIILIFFISDNIDAEKYAHNKLGYDAIQKHGSIENWRNFMERLSKNSAEPFNIIEINCTDTFKNSFKNPFDFALGIPDWFYCAYPDVVIWIEGNINNIGQEMLQNENEYRTEDDLTLFFFREMVDRYKLVCSKLECSI